MSAEPMSPETQQALLQYWEASKALHSSITEASTAKAITLMNQADQALCLLTKPPESLRARIEIVREQG